MVRSAKWRKVLLVLAIVGAVAGLGGAVAAIATYNEATKIDRTKPEVVVAEYLRALLVNSDGIGADLYSCEGNGDFAAIEALESDIRQRERDHGVSVVVEWGALSQREDAGTSHVTTTLTLTAIKDGVEKSSSSQSWRFLIVDEDGWRVCGAERVTTPSPAPSVSP